MLVPIMSLTQIHNSRSASRMTAVDSISVVLENVPDVYPFAPQILSVSSAFVCWGPNCLGPRVLCLLLGPNARLHFSVFSLEPWLVFSRLD